MFCHSSGNPAGPRIRFLFFACILLLATNAAIVTPGCSSSEETGAAHRAERPEPEPRRPQRAEFAPPDTSLQSAISNTPAGGLSRRNPPSVRRGQDTVRASTSRSIRASTQRPPLAKPPNAMYTIQIGAYRRATNALEMLKRAKKLHPENPVFNNYSTVKKLYKISVGKFETLREATLFRNRIAVEHPKLYTSSWVTYIQR